MEKMFKSKNCSCIITRYRDGGRSENLGRRVCKYVGAKDLNCPFLPSALDKNLDKQA